MIDFVEKVSSLVWIQVAIEFCVEHKIEPPEASQTFRIVQSLSVEPQIWFTPIPSKETCQNVSRQDSFWSQLCLYQVQHSWQDC